MNKIYSWGKLISSSFKQNQSNSQVACIETDQEINQISCGSDHCFFKSTQQIYALGSNQYGQLGININPHSQIQICRIFVPTKRKIVSLSCGWYHTLVLDQAGDLFSCGKGQDGALGLGNNQNSYGFKLVINGVRKMSAGKDHSLAICGPKVYGWGNTLEGQLGFQSKKKCYSPKQLNVYHSNQIFAGAKYSFFITIKGIYGTGLNNLNQLGLGHTKQVHYPKRLNIEETIIKIEGGNYCIAQTQSKEYYLWGSGGFGNYKFPTKFPFLQQCQKVSIGLNFGIALKKDKIYVWGSNRFGQLGIQSKNNENLLGKQYPYQCQQLSKMKLTNFQCGKNFVVGFSNLKNSMSWQKMLTKSQLNYNVFNQSSLMHQKIPKNNTFYKSNNTAHTLSKKNSKSKAKIVTDNSYSKNMQQFQLKINSSNKSQNKQQQNSHLKSNSQIQYNACTQEEIKVLTHELQNVKLQIQETNQRNQQLAQKNEELKTALQQCLETLEKEQKKNSQQNQIFMQNEKLRRILTKKTDYIAQIRHEYLTLSNMVQDNQFLRNVLSLSQENYRDKQMKLYQQGEEYQQIYTDAFSKQLNSLKRILNQANQV